MNLENISFIRHATFKISGSKIIYTDPFKIKEKDKADIILITHSHFDHCSTEDIEKLLGDDTTAVCSKDCTEKLKKIVPHVIGVEPYDEANVQGVHIKAVPAYNINKKFHPKVNKWNGYVFTMDGVTYYLAGDTDLIPEMKDIKVDIAFLPVGGTYTMNVEEAAEAVKMINPKIAIPMHYGSIVGNVGDAERFLKLVGDVGHILQ